jgi:hypothetical protein
MLSLPEPAFMPCSECGASVARGDDGHACDEERRLEYDVFRFDGALGAWLATPQGRFEQYYAARARRS